MIVQHTDSGGNGWVVFAADWDGVVRAVRSFLFDEWGLTEVHDLDSDRYRDPLELDIAVTVACKGHHAPPESHTDHD